MLQSFSDRIKNSRWLGYVIVGVISVPFALWGIQSYVGGGGTNEAAEVNGEPIPVFQVQRIASQQRQRLRQQLGGSLPAGLDERLFMERALEQLIERELLRQAVADAGFRVTDETLRRNIRQQPMFRRDGQFDAELYRRLLSQAGLSPQQYEADVRAGYRIEQLRRGITDSGFVTADEARRMARLQRQERDLAVLVHPRTAAGAAVSLDEEALRAYYEQNSDAFQRPAQVRAAYLELDMAALRAQVEIDEETLRAEYRANQDRYGGQEERRAAHILIEADAQSGSEPAQEALQTARELRERLAEGADFETLAREHSDDPGSAGQGGDLGYVSRGSMVDAFEQALFSLEEEGAVSDPVRSPYGYHLIKLLDVGAAGAPAGAGGRGGRGRQRRAPRAGRRVGERGGGMRP
ncbi:MAG: SurA N-terminal domain-containing protein, partial [Halofilum sp. (in: g-proteobacteria)]|nr:SurA N-terminal domain-containing protein [Halofilum sp. (in: g-proteobacteria)]